jgi:hypothetical protein
MDEGSSASASGAVRTIGHLARRFAGSLSRRRPSAAERSWVRSRLTDAEWRSWEAQPAPDQRHTVMVARRFADAVPDAPRAAVAGALLHDIGKLEAGLGTFARVGATLLGAIGGARVRSGDGRIARYLDHEARGAAMLRRSGSEELTAALVGREPGAPERWRAALRRADDDGTAR